jgi:hypothetical protein
MNSDERNSEPIEMPRPTAAPLILAAGIVLMAAGVALGLAMSIVGAVVFAVGLGAWITHLLPGRGHFHEERVEPQQRPQAIAPAPGTVEQLQAGMPGYRMRLPLHIHPISAGIKGGLLGGLVMPIPALIWGWRTGHGIWYPINLLAGMVSADVDTMTVADLEQFHTSLFVAGLVIHVVMSLVAGLIYGVLLPTIPSIPKSLAWAALLMPLLWSALSFTTMSFVNPVLHRGVSWPWFILSQFIFGIVLATVVALVDKSRPIRAGILGGIAGAILMAVPAMLWGLSTGQGIWYPVNLLAAMGMPGLDAIAASQLREFNPQWLGVAAGMHAAISIVFGVAFALLLPKLPAIPGPIASGGMLMPLVWTSASYGLMGLINPLLQQEVDWPWFIVSQFVFGIVAAIVVARSTPVAVPPKGMGSDTASWAR